MGVSTKSEDNVGIRYLATPVEDTEALMFGVVICRVCRSVNLLQLLVVTSYKCSINSITDPNPVSNH
jgi:hypothetical protein